MVRINLEARNHAAVRQTKNREQNGCPSRMRNPGKESNKESRNTGKDLLRGREIPVCLYS